MAFARVAITDFTAGELSYKFYGRFDLEVYSKACQWIENWVPFPQGGVTTRPGTQFLDGTLANAAGRLIPFASSDTDCFLIELTNLNLRIWRDDKVVLTTLNYPITTPYTLAEIPYIQYQKVANKMIFVSRAHPIMVLEWEGLDQFSFTPLEITVATGIPLWTALTQYAKDDVVCNGNPLKVYKCEQGGISGFVLPVTYKSWIAHYQYYPGDRVLNEGGRTYLCTAGGISATSGGPATLEDDIVDGTVVWDYVTPTEASISGPITEDDRIFDGNCEWSWQYTKPFSQVDDYPGCVAFFLGRMWFAGSNNDPDVIWASEPSDFGCFDYFDRMTYTATKLKDADNWTSPEVPETEEVTYGNSVIGEGNAILIELSSEQDESIMWLCAADALIIGTATSEWVIPPDVTALNIITKIRSRLGSANMQAMVIGENPMFVQGSRARGYLREYAYLSNQSALDSPDLTYMAEHMLRDGAEQMDFQQVPQPVVYIVSDGNLMCMLYSKQYKTLAWYRFTTAEGGEIESVAVIPGEDDDQVYLIVNRPGGRWVEKVGSLWWSSPQLDSYYHTDAALATTTGLDRFDGDTVVIYDGDTDTRRSAAVAGGTLNTTPELGHAIWIGLPVNGHFVTLPIQTGSSTGGTGQTGIKRIGNVFARVIASWPFSAGIDPEHLSPARRVDDVTWLDKEDGDYSGDVRLVMESDWDRYGMIGVYAKSIFPTTILALVIEAEA